MVQARAISQCLLAFLLMWGLTYPPLPTLCSSHLGWGGDLQALSVIDRWTTILRCLYEGGWPPNDVRQWSGGGERKLACPTCPLPTLWSCQGEEESTTAAAVLTTTMDPTLETNESGHLAECSVGFSKQHGWWFGRLLTSLWNGEVRWTIDTISQPQAITAQDVRWFTEELRAMKGTVLFCIVAHVSSFMSTLPSCRAWSSQITSIMRIQK